MPQGPELLIIVGLVVLLFGGSQLPKLARSLGEARREFEKGNDEARNGSDPEPPAVTATSTSEREAEVTRREAEVARREAELKDKREG